MSRARHSLLYGLYMGSPLWRLRRWWWFARSPHRCEGCGCPLVLHRVDIPPRAGIAGVELPRVVTVHHRTYDRLGRERRVDVELLCWPCHCRRELAGRRRRAGASSGRGSR